VFQQKNVNFLNLQKCDSRGSSYDSLIRRYMQNTTNKTQHKLQKAAMSTLSSIGLQFIRYGHTLGLSQNMTHRHISWLKGAPSAPYKRSPAQDALNAKSGHSWNQLV